jgi:surface carbohydrate biosynthesis protein
MTNQPSTLIIPVENQSRELDGKLLLSCVAAERGFPVVLGSRSFVHFAVASLPRGVYLAKSMRSLSDRMFDILRKVGHEIVACDEEALVRAPDPQYWERRLSAGTIQKVSAIVAWGPDDARVFREYPGYAGAPIHITGNPRVDMMRREVRSFYDEDVEGIRKHFGRFVLVNTNFGWNNHFIPNFARISNQGKRMDEFMTKLVAHRSAIFESFKEMVPALSKALPEFTILVRPHPTESHVPWNEIAGEHGNVEVVHEGNVIPWLMACEALVHNSCTTAVEGFILDTPVVAYQPVRMENFDNELPNSLSHRVFSTDELGQRLRSILAGERRINDFPGRRKRIDQHVAALEGPLAAERVVDVLEQAGYADRLPPRSSPSQYVRGWVHAKARTCVKTINMRRPGHRNSIEYHAHRFPDIALAELREKVDRLGRQLGRFEEVRVRQLSRYLFAIDQ